MMISFFCFMLLYKICWSVYSYTVYTSLGTKTLASIYTSIGIKTLSGVYLSVIINSIISAAWITYFL